VVCHSETVSGEKGGVILKKARPGGGGGATGTGKRERMQPSFTLCKRGGAGEGGGVEIMRMMCCASGFVTGQLDLGPSLKKRSGKKDGGDFQGPCDGSPRPDKPNHQYKRELRKLKKKGGYLLGCWKG